MTCLREAIGSCTFGTPCMISQTLVCPCPQQTMCIQVCIRPSIQSGGVPGHSRPLCQPKWILVLQPSCRPVHPGLRACQQVMLRYTFPWVLVLQSACRPIHSCLRACQQVMLRYTVPWVLVLQSACRPTHSGIGACQQVMLRHICCRPATISKGYCSSSCLQ